MGKTLYFCEKPSQARDYESVLKKEGAFKKENGYSESAKYIVTYGFGHMMNTKQMGEYEDFGGWAWEAIPYYPKNSELSFFPNPTAIPQVSVLKKLFERNDIEMVVNATDAGREGELIFWEIYHYTKCKAPVKRVWISQLVEKEIVKGIENMKEADFYNPRKDAAYSRQYADWLLGMNLTVGFSIKVNMGRTLHIGRVQTPTLAILANRRAEIEKFTSKHYFEIEADFGGKYKGKWFKDKLGDTKFETKEEAEKIVAIIKGKLGKVTKKDVTEKKENPKTLFNLSDLQVEANKKYGYTADTVLNAAQALYETYKFATYPRTSSRHIGTAYIPELAPTLTAIKVGDYEKFADEILTTGIKTNKSFVDDTKLSDHHAIVPTAITPDLSRIKDEVKGSKVIASRQEIINIYDMIVRRFLSVFFPAARYEETAIITEVEGETFKTSGKVLIDLGWKKVYGKDDIEEEEEEINSKKKKEEVVKVQKLPPIDLNEEQNVVAEDLQAKETKPPTHYTEGQLIAIMENPRRLLDDEDLKETLKVTDAGLATSATRANIINNIISRGYVERKGKNLIATDLGMKLIQIAPETLQSPFITALWEQKLMDMEHAKIEKNDFNQEIEKYVKEIIEDLKQKELNVKFGHVSDGEVVGACPKCKGEVKETKGTFRCGTQDCFVIFKTIAKKEISLAQAKQLLTKGETAMMRGFKTKEGKSFSAKLVIREGEVKLETAVELEVKCPTCEAQLLGTDKVVKCPNDDSHILIFTTVAGKKIGIKEIKLLVEKGQTGVISGFVSKAGKKFDAMLAFENGKVAFKFEEKPKYEKKETGIKCPHCDGEIVENEKAFGCTNWKEKECKFVAWKVMSGRPMTAKDYKEILEKEDLTSPKKLEGFVSKANKPFGAIVKYNKDNKRFEFVFETK